MLRQTHTRSPYSPAFGHSSSRIDFHVLRCLASQNHPYLVSGEAEPQWYEIRKQEAQADALLVKSGKKPLKRESIEVRANKALVQSSGKMVVLDKLLSKLKNDGGNHKVLIFTLFTRVLDLLEDYLAGKGWLYLRLDGSTNRVRRSVDIRRFNDPNSRFFVYLISTRAGGQCNDIQACDVGASCGC
jgi:SNF2 family DNA or RNA helicase